MTKPIDPVKSLRQVGGGNPHTEELAEFWAGVHGRVTHPNSAQDAKLSYGGGDPIVISERGDERAYPDSVVSINGDHIAASEPSTFGNPVTPVPFDGFGAEGSGVDNITGKY